MDKGKVVLLLTGDIMLGGEYTEFREKMHVDFKYSFTGIKPLFEQADIVFGNLECTLAKTCETREDKNMALCSPPESIHALEYLGYNIISLGNNHINDYMEHGLTETIRILKNNGFSSFGAGENLEQARQPAFIERGGLRFAFLGYTTYEGHVMSIIASANHAGCVFYDLPTIRQDIENTKDKADIICISLHWGYEYQLYPSPKQVALAHQIIDAGAKIVIGHHPHIIQGWERYKDGVIFYSLGNFFFPNYYDKSGILSRWQEESNRFIIARCRIGNQGIGEIEIIPGYRSDDQKVVILDNKRKEEAIYDLERLSLPITRSNYKNYWSNYQREVGKIQFGELLQRLRELGFLGAIAKLSFKNLKFISRILAKYILRI